MKTRLFKLNEIAIGNDDQATKTPFYSTDLTSGVVWVVKPGQKVPHLFSPERMLTVLPAPMLFQECSPV